MTNKPIYDHPDAILLRTLLNYNPDTGIFSWKARKEKRFDVNFADRTAGTKTKSGYVTIRFKGKRALAHRLAWLYVQGIWPVGVIDHIDRDRSNNRIVNLRDCSHQENILNRNVLPSSGVKGVYFRRKRKKWLARGYVDGKIKCFGSFTTMEEAIGSYERNKNLIGSAAPKKCCKGKTNISHAELLEKMYYDAETGDWYRKFKGDLLLVKTNSKERYHRIGLNYKSYCSHILAWFYNYGNWPNGIIDHIDLNSRNNAFKNLREVSRAENALNIKSKKQRGVRKLPSDNWMAQIKIDNKLKTLGTFSTFEDAKETFNDAYYAIMQEHPK